MRGATIDTSPIADQSEISIHAPLAGCDMANSIRRTENAIFQSTHPLRGATGSRGSDSLPNKYFNPRTPCGVRRRTYVTKLTDKIFQSTHPLRGATRDKGHLPAHPDNFNPRTPCGVRQRKCTKFSAHFAITDNSIGFPRPECRLLGHFLLIPGACSARERVRTFL